MCNNKVRSAQKTVVSKESPCFSNDTKTPPTNLPVQSAGSEEGGVKNVGSVGRHDELDLSQPVKPVHLVQQLHQGSLDLSVGRGPLREPSAPNGVYLVHEYDAGLVISGIGWERVNVGKYRGKKVRAKMVRLKEQDEE